MLTLTLLIIINVTYKARLRRLLRQVGKTPIWFRLAIPNPNPDPIPIANPTPIPNNKPEVT